MSDDFQKEVKLEFYRSGVQSTRDLGVMALKFLITLNSGAFVVLLTFIGNSAEKAPFYVPLPSIKYGMYCFLAGISLSFLTIAFAYFASQKISPYPTLPKADDGWFVPIVLSLALISFSAFLLGVFTIISNTEASS